jgi:Ca-activated chloride channel family protein
MSKTHKLFTILLIFFSISLVGQAQDDDEILKIESNLVILNASITDNKGKPILGLKQNEFRVFEDGEEQTLDFFESEETPFAAVILIDTSGSMETRVSLAMSAAINFLDGLRPDDNVAIYNFDSKVSMVQDFSNSRDISHSIFDLKANGWTVLNDAIFMAAEQLSKRPEKRRAIIVLSDGEDSKSKRSDSMALKAALDADATIYTVDMSDLEGNPSKRLPNQRVLKNFSEKSGGIFIKTPGGTELRDAFKNIVFELGTLYTIGYQPLNTKKDGKWRKIELRVKRPNLNIRTRKGYNAPKEK